MTRTITLTKGLPASGKSTWAKAQVLKGNGKVKRVNKDDLRAMLDNSIYSKGNEKFVLSIRDYIISSSLHQGFSVIVDDTNFASIHLETVTKIANIYKAEVIVKDFTDVPLELCIERDAARANPVGEKVIRGMYNTYLAPKAPAKIEVVAAPEYIEGAPKAIICDMDGTMSHLNGRDPFNASTCEQDLADSVIKDIVKTYGVKGYVILIMTGREAKYKAQTEAWLQNNSIHYSLLAMRPTGDFRKDSIVKEELYRKHVLGNYNVLFVLDDRDQVVQMWRSIGLKCLQVAPGNF